MNSINESEQKKQTLIISWDDLRKDVDTLISTLKTKREWKGIIAVTRGGLVPATFLAYDMGIRVVGTISLASYDDRHQQNTLEVLSQPSIDGEGEGWLVIDDLTDTGVTGDMVREILPKAYMAVVYAKPQGRKSVDLYAREIAQETWLVFPWEENF